MHIKSIRLHGFRRFTDLTISGIPPTTRLVVLAGPNGVGKSSVFDGFRTWQTFVGNVSGGSTDALYFFKKGTPSHDWNQLVTIEFHEPLPEAGDGRKKAFYLRSAYRNDPDFTSNELKRSADLLNRARVTRLIDNDASVSENYKHLVAQTIEGVYSGEHDDKNVMALRESFIGRIRDSMKTVFGDLTLEGPGDPLAEGSFFFEKGTSKGFHYKNLSGGEKAAFDLLLDMIVMTARFNDTVFCIDEPETHLNTRVQGALLAQLMTLLPATSQLWIATHSIGMLRKARDLHDAHPGEVVFLDFEDQDFDAPVALQPIQVNRTFWSRVLGVALDDLAKLVAPHRVVLCEGRPLGNTHSAKAEFDARCYRAIFANEFPDTDFISVGNSADVYTDRLEIGKAIQTVIAGTNIVRLVDRDARSPQEIADAEAAGIRVLSRRHLESYLADDEILVAFCAREGKGNLAPQVLAAKQQALAASVTRGNASDDVKSAMGDLYNAMKTILHLVNAGNTSDAFLRDALAPLLTSNTNTYAELRTSILGP